MKRTKVFAGLACALLAAAQLGCGAFKGATNKFNSVTLSVALVDGVAPTSQSGVVNLQGLGGTIQLQAMANYSNGKSADVTNTATYNVYVDPGANIDAFNNTLIPPCKAGTCPNPTQPPPYTTGTVEYSSSGLITAVEPAACTWVDTAPITTPGTTPTPAWAYSGDYVVTVTYEGVTSQPIYIPVASSTGNLYYPPSEEGNSNFENNPDGQCGPSTSGS